MTEVEYLSTNRELSALIISLQHKAGLSNKEMAESIGVLESTYITKLYRNSFTFNQISVLVNRCGFQLNIEPKATL